MRKLLTVTELAATWQVKSSWLYERTHRHAADPIPVVRVGRLLRFDSEQVSAWLLQKQERREVGS